MQDVKGKTAFVTGGASGIGLGMVKAFLGAGMNVVIADVNDKALDDARALGPNALPLKMNVTDPAAWESAAGNAEAAFGPVDLLCNNAGVVQGRGGGAEGATILDVSNEMWKFVTSINLDGVFYGVKTFAARMIARKQGGHIVNTASIAGLLATPGLGAYIASKFGVVGLSEALRAELAPHRIGVSILCPGSVASNLNANTDAIRAAMIGAAGAPSQAALGSASSKHMEPDAVGEFVLRAVRANDFYILTHPGYRDLLERRFATIRSALGEPAQAGYVDEPANLTNMTNPAYTGRNSGWW